MQIEPEQVPGLHTLPPTTLPMGKACKPQKTASISPYDCLSYHPSRHITQCRSACRQTRTPKEALQKTQYKQPRKRVANSRTDGENDEDEECADVYWISTDVGNLT